MSSPHYLRMGGDPRCHSGANLFMSNILHRKYHKSLKQGLHKYHLLKHTSANSTCALVELF